MSDAVVEKPEPPKTGPERPDGVSEDEWSALGDPGKTAIVRERARATAAEQALAAARTVKPSPPKPELPKPETPKQKDGEPADMAAMIRDAVAAAIAPLQEDAQQTRAEQAAAKIVQAVTDAAKTRFHDPSDALGLVDLPSLTDGNGVADPVKITAALDDLLTRKPHLGKPVDTRRHTPANAAHVGAGGSVTGRLDDRVKAQLELMKNAL